MNASTLVGMVSTGPNAAVVASLGSDANWHIEEDWGFDGWRAVRAPAGIKFQRAPRGVIDEEVMVVRGGEEQRAFYEDLVKLARVPVHLVLLGRQDPPTNRLAPHLLFPLSGRDE